jgi:ABC-type antimicrobial peptide transport system permease subunit
MEEELRLQYGDARLYAWLTGLFGGSALLLALLGIYGVVTHSVSRRCTELGVRLAVGAARADIVTMVIGQSTRPVLLGLFVGAAVALACARFLESLVYGLTPADPATHAGVALLLLAVTIVACYLPARRAASLDPQRILNG